MTGPYALTGTLYRRSDEGYESARVEKLRAHFDPNRVFASYLIDDHFTLNT